MRISHQILPDNHVAALASDWVRARRRILALLTAVLLTATPSVLSGAQSGSAASDADRLADTILSGMASPGAVRPSNVSVDGCVITTVVEYARRCSSPHGTEMVERVESVDLRELSDQHLNSPANLSGEDVFVIDLWFRSEVMDKIEEVRRAVLPELFERYDSPIPGYLTDIEGISSMNSRLLDEYGVRSRSTAKFCSGLIVSSADLAGLTILVHVPDADRVLSAIGDYRSKYCRQ